MLHPRPLLIALAGLAGVATAVVTGVVVGVGGAVAGGVPTGGVPAGRVSAGAGAGDVPAGWPRGGIAFPAPTTPPGPGSSAENAVFALLNQQRAAHGLGPLGWSPQLAGSSLTHNQAMAAAGVLSHQLPGEPSFGDRITATGYRWRWAAENIGWTSQTTDAGAVSLQQAFYDEAPPNDGHRQNILSTNVTQVGLSVPVDGRGKLWVTEDFAAPQ